MTRHQALRAIRTLVDASLHNAANPKQGHRLTTDDWDIAILKQIRVVLIHHNIEGI